MFLKSMAIYGCITNLFSPQVCWSPILLATESDKRWTPYPCSLRQHCLFWDVLEQEVDLCSGSTCTALPPWPPGMGHTFYLEEPPCLGFQQNKRLGGSSSQRLISQTQVRAMSAHVSRALVCHGGSCDSWWWHCICSPDASENYNSFILLTLVVPVCSGSHPID